MSDLKKLVLDELNPALKVTLIKTNKDLGALEDFFHRSSGEICFDTETNIVNTLFKRKCRTFQFGNRDEQYVVDLLHLAGSTEDLQWQGQKKAPAWAEEFVRVCRIGLETPNLLKVGVNMQFDYEVSRWCFGLRPFNFYDCHLAEKVLYMGKVRFDSKVFWGMDNMVARYASLIIDKTEQKGFDLETELTPGQIAYAALDVRLPLAVKGGQSALLDKYNLRHTVEVIECPAIPMFGDMKIAGFKVDRERWITQVKKVEIQVAKDVEEMDKAFIPIVGVKKGPDLEELARREKAWRDAPASIPALTIVPDFEGTMEKVKSERQLKRDHFMELRKQNTQWLKDCKTYQGQAAINYGSNPQVLEALQKSGVKIESTGEDVLKAYQLKLNTPNLAIKALRDYRTTDKLLDTYGYKFLDKYVDPDTERIHSNKNQIGADTGRTSDNKPNLQNIPQESDKDDLHYRSAFVARPGYVLITRDYDGCELRIIAELSGEEAWVDAFNNGYDVHSICAELIYGDEWKNGADEGCAYYAHKQKCDCKKHKALRNSVKAVSFGLAYGAEAGNIAEQLGITKNEAQVILNLHKRTFPKVHAMLADVAQSSVSKLEVRTIAGRRRLFNRPNYKAAKEMCEKNFIEDERDPKSVTSRDVMRKMGSLFSSIEREGKNTPFQGGNADIAKVAMSYMWPDLEPVYGAFLVNFVHDEFVVECPIETAEQCNIFMGEMMEKAGSIYIHKVKMTSGGNIADCWSK